MRLKHIKLAGFKSFVDPTTVPFEHQMTAIVGPNGCGKSNIIDAVRWVLGESSAKNLRGDAMTDVIFNGAASRKPIGQASVELVFDNAQGRIKGSMADRSQVSVRRVVNREGTNSYYLNGSKCRRRDITEIFLGTGLGPRSYAIIEQGTISRLIESKPQELRVFIEEAAGISKYKERRRETENRIKHTRENLSRLGDIRAELTGQIDKLHQQAEAAKRFRTLKQQERKYKAELAVLRWQKFEKQRTEHHSQTLLLENKISAQHAQQTSNELKIISIKDTVRSCNELNLELQQTKLAVTQNIARAEQNVKHLKEKAYKTQQDESLIQQQLINAQELALSEQGQLQSCLVKLSEKEPELLLIEVALSESQKSVKKLQQEQVTLQSKGHEQQQKRQKNQEIKFDVSADIAKQNTVIDQLSQQLASIESQQTSLPDIDSGLLTTHQQNSQNAERDYNHNHDTLLTLRSQEQKYHKESIALAKQHAMLEVQYENKKSVIEQLNNKLLSDTEDATNQKLWLNDNNIKRHGQLKDKITIEAGWEKAADIVIAQWLLGDIIDKPPQLTGNIDCEQLVINIQQSSNDIETAQINTLASKVIGYDSLNAWLNTIFVADDYGTALNMLAGLKNNQSIICPDGTWLSTHTLRKGNFNSQPDFLQYQKQLVVEEKELSTISQNIAGIELQQSEHSLGLLAVTQKLAEVSAVLKQQQETINSSVQKVQLLEQQHRHTIQQKQSLVEQKNIIDLDISKAKERLVSHESQLINLPFFDENIHDGIVEQQKNINSQIQDKQKESDDFHHQRHQLALVIEQLKSQRSQFEQSLFSNQQNINVLMKRQEENSQSVSENNEPLHNFEQSLPIWLDELTAINSRLELNQKTLNDSQTQLSEIELAQKSAQHKVSVFSEQLTRFNLDNEGFKLRAESALDVLKELNQDVKSVLNAMPENAKESIWQAHIIKLAKDIQLLGAINLAAIEEYETQFERKNYLDQQDQDLNKAISTLETAIAKIDKETRQKFKFTFDQVNKDLKRLFPKVFGGGEAYLALTEDDLLETGVTIMARPPGKKNSTIHLLSGGEKALTALSLVFAIFRLNPAPFCLLDEVDAPLDDANVSRFCNLVQEMSQTVQFIYISHNKIAMEMASHLTGVTMFEAGVSRMVAVDIDEAIAMAEV